MAADDVNLNLKPLLLGDVPRAAISDCGDAAKSAARRELKSEPSIDWEKLGLAFADKIEEMFDLPLLGSLLHAWEEFREIEEAADTEKHKPGESTTVALVDHDIEASFEPHLEVSVNGVPTAKIRFEIVAALELHAVELVIENAAIRALRIGSCQAAAQVKCAGAVVFDRTSRKLELPGEITLAKPVPLGAPAAKPAA